MEPLITYVSLVALHHPWARSLGKAYLTPEMKEVTVTTRTATPTAPGRRGVLYVHSAPSALCPHIEWAVGGVLGVAVNLDWIPQPAQPAPSAPSSPGPATAGTAAALASALRGWNHLRFEVTEEPTPATEGARYSYTPELGVFHAVTGMHGDIMIPEDRLQGRRGQGRARRDHLLGEIDKLLGKPWDDELETFRYAGEGAPVRWLHQVV